MATVKSYTVASMFLRALGAPDTSAMRRAVAIWLRFESGGSITGNNPWNLHNGAPCKSASRYCPGAGSLPGQIGNRYAGPGDQNVAVFRTLDDGTRASAQNLIRLAPSYGYGKVISEARQGDAIGFLVALQNSSWSAGHYGYSKLVTAFRGSFNYNTTLTLRAVGGGSSTVPTTPAEQVGDAVYAKALEWAISQGIEPNTTITAEQWTRFVAWYVKQEGQAPNGELAKLLLNVVSKSWVGKATWAEIGKHQAQFPAATDPLKAIADALGSVSAVLAFFLDVENWLYIIAIGAGVGLAGYGFAQLTGARIGVPRIGPASMIPTPEPEEA